MCGRFSLQTPMPELAGFFDADASRLDEWPARYNVAPTHQVLALRRKAERGREIVPLRWGLPGRSLLINARRETLETRPSFRNLIFAGRCAVLADGFYEWRTEGGLRQPYFVRRRDGAPMALAGLWQSPGEGFGAGRRGAAVGKGGGGREGGANRGGAAAGMSGGERERSAECPGPACTIITTDASDLLAPLHDRIPVILPPAGTESWVDGDFTPRTLDALVPAEPPPLELFAVSRRVNRVASDDPGCLEPLSPPVRRPSDWRDRPPAGHAPPGQLGLFPAAADRPGDLCRPSPFRCGAHGSISANDRGL